MKNMKQKIMIETLQVSPGIIQIFICVRSSQNEVWDNGPVEGHYMGRYTVIIDAAVAGAASAHSLYKRDYCEYVVISFALLISRLSGRKTKAEHIWMVQTNIKGVHKRGAHLHAKKANYISSSTSCSSKVIQAPQW